MITHSFIFPLLHLLSLTKSFTYIIFHIINSSLKFPPYFIPIPINFSLFNHNLILYFLFTRQISFSQSIYNINLSYTLNSPYPLYIHSNYLSHIYYSYIIIPFNPTL
jgi:hypothetical protein